MSVLPRQLLDLKETLTKPKDGCEELFFLQRLSFFNAIIKCRAQYTNIRRVTLGIVVAAASSKILV